METVAFYSYKGGVGRTLLVANTAQFLAMAGRRVVALDLDLEAPGLHQKLADPAALQRAASGELPGAVDALLAALEGDPRTLSLRQIALEIDLPAGTGGSLFLIPAGSAPSHAYWAAFERLNGALRAHPRDGGLPEAVLELQARIAEEFAPDFLLIDSRTGITELGGLATSILADRVVCLTTAAPESVEGTRVVAEALRQAPRLSSQQPLRIDFLITRVTPGSRNAPNVARVMKELGGSVAVLPHDAAITNEERVLAGWGPGRTARLDYSEEDDAGKELFSATLRWIAESFPVHKQEAERTRHRMEAVHRAWQDLTRPSVHVRGGTRSRPAWPAEQLRERVRFGKEKKWREADIVAYDRPAGDSAAKPLMIIEYVDREDRDSVAHWWLRETSALVVAVLAVLADERADQRLYSSQVAWDSRARSSERWDLPLPHDFEALSDPTDTSVEALLGAVRRGHPEYLDRLVTEWVHCSASGLHGGAPWKPDLAKKILDGLASVDDAELARRVLWSTSLGPGHREMWLGDFDDYLDEQVLAELFTPLLWRLPPEASVELMQGRGRPFGPPAGLLAIRYLARDLLGLRYDPDATLRREGQALLARKGQDTWDTDRGLYAVAPAFRTQEISFEISAGLPPLARPEPIEGDRPHREPADLGRLVADRIAARTLVTTGLLGNYLPELGRVVLYREAIERCADKLALRARHVGSVTFLHETIHALTHLGRDLDGRMWPEFALPSASHPLFEPSFLHETLAQYFTYQQLVRLQDPALLHAFEIMSDRQSAAYRRWRQLRHVPLEDVRSWFLSIRRGVGNAAPVAQLLMVPGQSDGD
jgi:MinD-like ATPase involved in chromosome partitioning or flagellar assembly